MSSHADTIRRALRQLPANDNRSLAHASLDALLAENQRYEKALELLAKLNDPAGRIAREALAGDAE